jgi:hypothetical protein
MGLWSRWPYSRRGEGKLPIGMDAKRGEIVAAAVATNDVDDASRTCPLLDRVEGRVASFIGDGAHVRTGSILR